MRKISTESMTRRNQTTPQIIAFLILPLHPIWLSIFFVLGLWLTNIGQIPLFAITRTIIFIVIVLFLIFASWQLIYRNISRTAIITSLTMVLFLTYGHIYQLFNKPGIPDLILGHHRYLLVLWVILFIFFVWLVTQLKGMLMNFTILLNLTTSFLLLFIIIQFIYSTIYYSESQINTNGETDGVQSLLQDPVASPDIYYLIIDSFSRQDVMANRYDVDISDFVNQLETMGFVIPNCAQSNYTNTIFSMTSALNMNYLDKLEVPIPIQAKEIKTSDFANLIQYSSSRKLFESLGYTIVTFKTIYPPIDIADSDIYYDVSQSSSSFSKLESVNFLELFIQTTILRVPMDILRTSPERLNSIPSFIKGVLQPLNIFNTSQTYQIYRQNMFVFETIEDLPKVPGPKFVYAHIFVTHEPFVFTANGDMRSLPDRDTQAFRDSVSFGSNRLLQVVRELVESSTTPPVIILQADHGYGWNADRSKILNAYYLPGIENNNIYNTITPVNTFRMIFRLYFNFDYPPLSDQTFFSEMDSPYKFEMVPVNCED